MAAVEIRDETVIVVGRGAVAAVLAQRRRWREWWPQSEATVVVDRGVEGMTWALTGALVGTTQVVLVEDGARVQVRYAMSVDPAQPGSRTAGRTPPASPRGQREIADLRRRQMLAWKQVVWALKEELEDARGRTAE